MAADLRGPEVSSDLSRAWIRETRLIDRCLVDARGWSRRATESHGCNPRRLLGRAVGDPAAVAAAVERLEVAVSSTRGLAQSIHRSVATSQEWDDDFHVGCVDVLDQVGRRLSGPGEEDRGPARRLDDLTRTIGRHGLEDLLWPLYGRLISDLSDVVDVAETGGPAA